MLPLSLVLSRTEYLAEVVGAGESALEPGTAGGQRRRESAAVWKVMFLAVRRATSSLVIALGGVKKLIVGFYEGCSVRPPQPQYKTQSHGSDT